MTCIAVEHDPFTETVEWHADRLRQGELVRQFIHADGSHTFIEHDPESEHANPRGDDGNMAKLVQMHRDYIDLDDADDGIEDVRGAASVLDGLTGKWSFQRDDEGDGVIVITHRRGYSTCFSLEEPSDVRVIRAYFDGLDEEEMVRRYIEEERPDIAHYEHRWTVQGCSQSDWQYGWGYVLTEDFIEGRYSERQMGLNESERAAAASVFDQELDTYGQWFVGEVYGGIHISKGKPVVAYGDEGAYVTGHEADEDSCWGFLGYDDLRDIAANFTASPVVEEIW